MDGGAGRARQGGGQFDRQDQNGYPDGGDHVVAGAQAGAQRGQPHHCHDAGAVAGLRLFVPGHRADAVVHVLLSARGGAAIH